ncbi:MAG: hypothetical protein WAN65_22140, partial [Candidatus Sulfotelmatobacter sp.]
MAKGFASIVPTDANVEGVADAIVKVVDTPFGKRPFRVHYDPTQDGAEVVNMVSDRVRAELLRRIGLTDVLTPRDFLRLQSFLQSGREVMNELCLPEDPAARTQQILARAAKQFDQLSDGASAVVKDFVRRVVQRVVVHPDRIEVEVVKQKLRDILTADSHISSSRSATHQPEQASSDVIRFNIEARVKRCGGEMRLVFPPDHPGQAPPSPPALSLLKALARGRQWYESIVAGEVSGRRSIAQELQLDERYIGRVLECAFLAPDIVEAILDGRQPPDLTFKKLTHRIPFSWMEQ